MGLKEHLEDHLISAYVIGTKKEIDYYDSLYRIRHSDSIGGFSGAPFGMAAFAQLVALGYAFAIGETTGSSVCSIIGGYLGADLSWRVLKNMVFEDGIGHQSGLIGTVRTLYKKFTNKSKPSTTKENQLELVLDEITQLGNEIIDWKELPFERDSLFGDKISFEGTLEDLRLVVSRTFDLKKRKWSDFVAAEPYDINLKVSAYLDGISLGTYTVESYNGLHDKRISELYSSACSKTRGKKEAEYKPMEEAERQSALAHIRNLLTKNSKKI